MAIYETVVILDSLLPTKEIDDIIERCSTVVKENGGKVRTVDKWGKRRLAYEIQKKQYGFYFTLEFEGEGNIPAILQSEYNYNDSVLRYLTYKYDKHKLKAMEPAPAAKVIASDEESPVRKNVVETPKAEVEEAPVPVKETPEVVEEGASEAAIEETAVLDDEKPEVVEEEASEVVAEETSMSEEETPEIAKKEEESTKEAKDE